MEESTLEAPAVLARDTAVMPQAGAPQSLEDQIVVGMGHCRRREWHSALQFLEPLRTMSMYAHRAIPARAWSCLGLATARVGGRRAEGLSLCRSALQLDPEDPEVHVNLVWCLLIVRQRHEAASVLVEARKVWQEHAGLRDLHDQLGIRQRPVLSFLTRGNALNRWLGAQRFERNCGRAREKLLRRPPRAKASPHVMALAGIVVFILAVGAAMVLPGRTAVVRLRVGDAVLHESKPFGTITAYEAHHQLQVGDPVPAFQIQLADGSGSLWMTRKAAEASLQVQ